MARKIWLSILVLGIAFCLGLSLLAAGGAWIVVREYGAVLELNLLSSAFSYLC